MPTLNVRASWYSWAFGLWDWQEEDYDKPLAFPLVGAKAFLGPQRNSVGKSTPQQKREVAMRLQLTLQIHNPSALVLAGIKTSGKRSHQVATQIYSYYREVMEKFEGLLRNTANVHYLLPDDRVMSIDSLFGNNGSHSGAVVWWLDSEQPIPFKPKLSASRRRFNPLFQRDQLIDKKKWSAMQRAIDENNFPSNEMLELLRLRSQVAWRGKKVPTIEAAVFAETILRDYAFRVLLNAGLSKTRLQSFRDDLSFNLLLNAVLPLTLTKTEAKSLHGHITAVDVLRKIRNDVAHGNIAEKDIDESAVRKGIGSTIRLVQAIRSKLRTAT